MKLNEGLINMIMVFLEEKLEYDKTMQLVDIVNSIPSFIKEKGYTNNTNPSEQEIKYALKKIVDLNFVQCDLNHNSFLLTRINDITLTGFRYINNPRLF